MDTSPFKLLEHYTAGDKDIFFGRDQESRALCNLLQQAQISLVYGASGTGKTSLIHAGLPKVFKIADWFMIPVKRRDHLVNSLCSNLGTYLNEAPIPEAQLTDALRRLFVLHWIPIYLVFDQFEEIFIHGDEEEREQFFRTLSSILRENTTIKILFSLREEYLGHLYAYEYFLPNLFEHRFRVEAMQDDTVVEVISRTCRVHGIQMEKGNDIPGIIVAHLKQGKRPVHLPYLQIYLYALYGKAMEGYGKARFDKALIEDPDNSLEKVLYRFIGGKLAEAQAFLQEKHQQLPLDFAEKLLDDFATEIGTKKAWRIAELAEKYRLSPPLIKDALQYFAETAKLLRADENEVERYEPVHDVVAQQIHERRSEESKEYKLFLSQLNVYLSQWERDNRSAERLLRGSDVAKAEICRKRLEREERGNLYVEYVQLSREYVTKTRRAEKQQLKKEQDLRKTAEEALVEAEEQRNLAQANEGKAKRFLRMAYGVALALMIAAIAAVYLYTETNKNYRTIERKEIERKAQELLSFGDNYKDLGKSMDASNNYQAALNLLNKHLPDYPELKETQLYQQLLKK